MSVIASLFNERDVSHLQVLQAKSSEFRIKKGVVSIREPEKGTFDDIPDAAPVLGLPPGGALKDGILFWELTMEWRADGWLKDTTYIHALCYTLVLTPTLTS